MKTSVHVCAFKKTPLNWSHLGTLGKIFLTKKTVSQGVSFSPLCQVHFVLLLDHFILLRLKARKGREGSSCRLRVYPGLSAVLGLLHMITVHGM